MNKEQKSHKLNVLILLSLTALVLFIVMKDDFNNIVEHLLTINLLWLMLAFAFIFIYWGLRSLGLHILTKKINSESKFTSSYQLIMRTQFVNAVTPFASGGQPYQVYYLATCGTEASRAASVIIQNSIAFQIALVLIGLIAVLSNLIFGFFDSSLLLSNLVALGFIFNTTVIVMLFILSFSRKANQKIIHFGINILTKLRIVKDKVKKKEEWDKYIYNFHDSAKVLLEKKFDFLLSVLAHFLALIVIYSIPLIVAYATGVNGLGIYEIVVASAHVMLIGALVPIPGGTGGLEYGFMTLYGKFIVGSKLAAIMIIWRFLTYYFGIIVGGIAMNMRKVKL